MTPSILFPPYQHHFPEEYEIQSIDRAWSRMVWAHNDWLTAWSAHGSSLGHALKFVSKSDDHRTDSHRLSF